MQFSPVVRTAMVKPSVPRGLPSSAGVWTLPATRFAGLLSILRRGRMEMEPGGAAVKAEIRTPKLQGKNEKT